VAADAARAAAYRRDADFSDRRADAKTGDIRHDSRVNVAFRSDTGDCYVSVGGTATVVHDER
jgi:general stress protein 26